MLLKSGSNSCNFTLKQLKLFFFGSIMSNLKYVLLNKLTHSINQNTWQNQIKNIKQRSPPYLNNVGNIRIGLQTARIMLYMLDGRKTNQIELPVSLVIGDVSFFGLFHNIQLKQNIFTDGNISIGRKQSFNEINVK